MMDAMQMKYGILAALAAVGSVISNALGGWDHFMRLLGAVMVLDYFTGLAVAALWKKSPKTGSGALSSAAGFKGLIKKGTILLVVWVAVLLDQALGVNYVRTGAILFFIGNEGLSVVENLGLMGVPFPEQIMRMFELLREKGDQGEAGGHG